MEPLRTNSVCYCETAERDETSVSAAEEPFYAPSRPENRPPCATYPCPPILSCFLRHTTYKHIRRCYREINRSTDRKLFDIKLLVFRGKSHRNFLFYTRRKNYFHIRLSCILQACTAKALTGVYDEIVPPFVVISVIFKYEKARKL